MGTSTQAIAGTEATPAVPLPLVSLSMVTLAVAISHLLHDGTVKEIEDNRGVAE